MTASPETKVEYLALPHAADRKPEQETRTVPPEITMLLASLVVTALNSTVRALPISLLVLLAGRYVLQWAICVVTILLRSALLKQPARFFGPPGQRHWLALRGMTYLAFIWLWSATLRLVPVGNAVIVVKFECFITGIGSYFAFGESLSPRWWLCSVMAIFGVVLVTQPPFIFGGDNAPTSHLGMILNVLAPICAGSMPLLIKMAPDAHFMEVQHVTDLITGILGSLPLLLLLGNPTELLEPFVQRGVFVVAMLGIAALCMFTVAYQRGSAGRLSLLGYIEIPASYFAQVIIFKDKLDPVALCGALLVTAASIAVAVEDSKK